MKQAFYLPSELNSRYLVTRQLSLFPTNLTIFDCVKFPLSTKMKLGTAMLSFLLKSFDTATTFLLLFFGICRNYIGPDGQEAITNLRQKLVASALTCKI